MVVDPAANTEKNQKILIERLSEFQPSAVFLTHHHHDHIGSATLLREHFDIPIIAHKLTDELVHFPVDKQVDEGHHFTHGGDTWTAIHTPGHAPGHLCLISNADQSLIAGDMVAGEGTILINPSEGSIREYIHSLHRLRTFAPSRLLPAHGGALDNADELLQEYISHRKNRLMQIWKHLSETPQSSLDLAARIYTELPKAYLGMAAIQVHCGLLFLEQDSAVQKVKSPENGWVRSQTDYSITI